MSRLLTIAILCAALLAGATARAAEDAPVTLVIWYCKHEGAYYGYLVEIRDSGTGAPLAHWRGGNAGLRAALWLHDRYPGRRHFGGAKVVTERECLTTGLGAPQ